MSSDDIHLPLKQSLKRLQDLDFGMQSHPAFAKTTVKQHGCSFVDLASQTFSDANSSLDAATIHLMKSEFQVHLISHEAELRRLLDGGTVGDFDFVRAYADEHAAHQCPIDVTMKAYQNMHPVLCQWLRVLTKSVDTNVQSLEADALDDFARQYIGAINIAYATAYAAQASSFAVTEKDRRVKLLSLLLDGFDQTDSRVPRLLRQAGYFEQRQRFCVVVAQSADLQEMGSALRVQRIADSIGRCVASLQVGALIGVHNGFVAAVFSDNQLTSEGEGRLGILSERLKERLLRMDSSVFVGLSGDQPTLTQIPNGFQQAMTALDNCSGSEPVLAFHALSIRRLLIHRGSNHSESVLPVWFSKFKDADKKSRGQLVLTLRFFADCDMNVQSAARILRVHANTIYARFQRIQDLTALNAQKYHDLSDLLLAMDYARL